MAFTYMHMRQREREVPPPLSGSRVRKHVAGRSNRREAFAALSTSAPLSVSQRLAPKYEGPGVGHPSPYPHQHLVRPSSAQPRGGSLATTGRSSVGPGGRGGNGNDGGGSAAVSSRPQSASPRVGALSGRSSTSTSHGGGGTPKRPFSAHPSSARAAAAATATATAAATAPDEVAMAASATSPLYAPSRPTGPPEATAPPWSMDHDYHTGDWPGLRPARPAKTTTSSERAAAKKASRGRPEAATTGSAFGNPGSVRTQLRERLAQRGIDGGRVFVYFNRARRGAVSRQAFREGLERMHVTATVEAMDALFDELDVKGDGQLDHSELAAAAAAAAMGQQRRRPQSAAVVSMAPRPPTASALDRACAYPEPESQRRPGSALPAASNAGFRRPFSAPANRRVVARQSEREDGEAVGTVSGPPGDAERAAVFRDVIKKKLEERGKGDREAFHFFDRNKDGRVNPAEFRRALEGLNLGITAEDAKMVFEQCRAEAEALLAKTSAQAGKNANGHDPNTVYAPMITLAGGRPGEYQGGRREGAEVPPHHLHLTQTRERVARAKASPSGGDVDPNVGGSDEGMNMDYRQFRAAFMTPDVARVNAMERVWNETRKLTPSEVYAATFTGRGKSGGGGRGEDGGDGSGPPHGATRRVVDGSEQARRVTWSAHFANQALSLDPKPTHYVPPVRF